MWIRVDIYYVDKEVNNVFIRNKWVLLNEVWKDEIIKENEDLIERICCVKNLQVYRIDK